MMRLFIALPLEKNVEEELGKIISTLKQKGGSVKCVKPENIHLTVKFLGEISPESVRQVCQAAETAAASASAMELAVKGLGVFPDARRPRVVWAGLSGAIQSLIDFHAKLEENLVHVGFDKEKRRFTAHLTLGRVKKSLSSAKMVSALDACSAFTPRPISADRLVLYKSELRPEGAVYTALQAFPLAG